MCGRVIARWTSLYLKGPEVQARSQLDLFTPGPVSVKNSSVQFTNKVDNLVIDRGEGVWEARRIG